MTGHDFVGGVAVALICLLFAAAAHKARLLRSGRTHEQSIMQRSKWRREHAAILILVAAAAEVACGLLLVLAPSIGFAIFLLLAVVYLGEVARLPGNAVCECFGDKLASGGRVSALVRNVLLVAASAAALVLSLHAPADFSPTALGFAVLFLSVIVAIDLIPNYPVTLFGVARPRVANGCR